MTHRAYQEPGPLQEYEVDYVVVGSGAGGSTAAVDLARGGAKVAVVEAGAWRDPKDYPTSMYGTLRDMVDDWSSLVTQGSAFWPVLQARLVGGGTVINSAIVVRTPGDIFQEWERDHGIGGDKEAERVWAAQDKLEEELSVEPVPEATEGRSSTLAEKGARALGFHDHRMERNVRDCLGRGQCLQGCRDERKQSTNMVYMPEVMNRGGLVLSCAPVHKVIFEGQRAVGVRGRFKHPQTRARGAEFIVRAKRAVVMAASATHSPAILLRSGLKPWAMGRFFRAHPGAGISGRYADPVNPNVGATQGWSSMHFRSTERLKLETLSLPLEVVASRVPGGGPAFMEMLQVFPYLAMWILAVRAEAVGRVKLNPLGGLQVQYSVTRRDMERFRFGAIQLAQMHVEAGAEVILPGIHGVPHELKPDEIHVLEKAPLDPRSWTGALTHLFGGCVMGADPKRSVCDRRGRVHGIDGLAIADASMIPTTLGVNPQHTIMALARLRAHELLDDES